jgi:hypothetical protein
MNIRELLASKQSGRKPGGLYGFTKQTQRDCEVASRAIQREAKKIARSIRSKDRDVVPFLATHGDRGSTAARLLTAALGELGPKAGSRQRKAGSVGVRASRDKQSARNDRYLAKALLKMLFKIQKDSEKDLGEGWGKGGKYDPVADTGVWVGQAETKRYTRSGADVVLHFDGAGYDYFNYNTPLRQYRQMVQKLADKYGYMMEDINNWSIGFYYEGGHRAASNKTAGWAKDRKQRGAWQLVGGPWCATVYPFGGDDVGMFGWHVVGCDSQRKGEEQDPVNPPNSLGKAKKEAEAALRSLNGGRTAKKREYGMYGFRTKTATLSLAACAEVKGAAGRVTAKLHGRRATRHAKITGFLERHSAEAGCPYARVLHGCYPDASRKCASAAPTTVAGWLALGRGKQATRIPSNAPRQVKQVAKASIQNAKEAGDDDRVHISNHEEGRWVIGDNYEQMANLVYYEGKDEWYYMPNWGSEKLIQGGLREALANASIMWTG